MAEYFFIWFFLLKEVFILWVYLIQDDDNGFAESCGNNILICS